MKHSINPIGLLIYYMLPLLLMCIANQKCTMFIGGMVESSV